jgi:transposase
VVVLRSYLRQRQILIRYAGQHMQHMQHMQKALEQMNVKLTEVVSDIASPSIPGKEWERKRRMRWP